MPTDKSWRSVGGQSALPTRGADEYQVKRSPAPVPQETRNAPPSQARSPAPQHLGATRGTSTDGTRVPEKILRSDHSRAWGIEST